MRPILPRNQVSGHAGGIQIAGVAAALASKTDNVASSIKAGVFASSRRLGANLEAAGFARGSDMHAHHLVAGRAWRAAPAREVLAKYGVHIDDAANGVFLTRTLHQGIHTADYYYDVNKALRAAQSTDQVLDILDALRSSILARSG